MNNTFILIMGVVAVLFVSGCAQVEKECDNEADCQTKTCFTVQCKDDKCAYSSIANCCGNDKCETGETYGDCPDDCPNCDDKNDCTTDEYDYHEQECSNTPILDVVCCGNGVCEIGENYEACTRDCPMCDDDNDCTTDSYDYHEQECIYEPVTPCCGNGVCDEGSETNSDCPTDCLDCDDNKRLTGDIFNYATQQCEYVTYYFFEDFDTGSASWNLDTRWTIVFPEDETNGMLTKDDDASYAFTSFGEKRWTDYTLRLKVKLVQGSVEVSLRADFGGEGAYAVSISENWLALAKDAEPRVDFETKGYAFGNQTRDIGIEVKGSDIKVYVDNELEISYTDTDNPILAGNVALYISDKAYLDEIIVEAPQ